MNSQKFLEAQNGQSIHGNTLYEQALKEIQEGKLGFECWIRYIFPQLKGLGKSKLTEYYGLDGREEAIEYINHPVLRDRLVNACQVLLDSKYSIYDTFSQLGVLKVRACMLLFASVSDIPIFKEVITKYKW